MWHTLVNVNHQTWEHVGPTWKNATKPQAFSIIVPLFIVAKNVNMGLYNKNYLSKPSKSTPGCLQFGANNEDTSEHQ